MTENQIDINQNNNINVNEFNKKMPIKNNNRKLIISVIVIFSILVLCILSCVLLMFLGSLFSNEGFLNTNDTITNNSKISQVQENEVFRIKKENTNTSTTNKIAIINLNNEILYTTNPDDIFTGTNNLSLNVQIQKALSDNSVKAIVLRFNTPGGVVNAAEPMCREIKKLNEKKPVYAFIDTEAASLGYLLANCTKYIYSRPTAITGSIGVRLDLIDISQALQNLGVKQITITNTKGTKKTQEGLFNPNSEEYKQIQQMLDETYNYFIDVVWANRSVNVPNKLTKEKLLSYADGRIFSGKQAFDAGLVDKLGEYEDVISDLIEKENLKSEFIVVEYNIKADFFRTLFGMTNKMMNLLLNTEYIQSKKLQLLFSTDY